MNKATWLVRGVWARVKYSLDWVFLNILVGGRFFPQLYYSIFNLSFLREHAAVLAGRRAYKKALTCHSESSVLLRRNVHRLEKGLIMRPRRTDFAKGYIMDTVIAYQSCVTNKVNNGEMKAEETEWAYDVLTEYFDVVDHSVSAIQSARDAFLRISYCSNVRGERKPYCRDLTQPPPVTYGQLLELSKLRRSVRWYKQKQVPRQIIDRALKVAAYSPSACNRQPFHFRIFDEPQKIQRVASIPMGTAGFSHNFPGIIVLVGRLDAYFDERDRHVIYIDASLAAMSLIYALETQGVSTCAINWPDIGTLENKMAKELALKPYEKVIMLISYGYPDPQGQVPFSQKKPLDQIRSYNL